MFNLRFTLEAPWLDRFENIRVWAGSTPVKHKFWELQVMKSDDIVAVDIRLTTRQDHAGLDIWLGFAGYAVNFKVYDSRHWDYDNKSWEVYGNV